MELKRFKLNIIGRYYDVPHPDRMMMLDVDEDPHNPLTGVEILVICNEITCQIKRRLHSVMTKKELDNFDVLYNKFHFGKVIGDEKCRNVNIHISGTYSDGFDKEGHEYKLEGITEGRAMLVLFEVMCVQRNELSKTMSRKELADIAEKHFIYNLGMTKDKEPFVTRGE